MSRIQRALSQLRTVEADRTAAPKRARAAVPRRRIDATLDAETTTVPAHHFEPLMVSHGKNFGESQNALAEQYVLHGQSSPAVQYAQVAIPVATPVGTKPASPAEVPLAISPAAVSACRETCVSLLSQSGRAGVIWGIVSLEPEPQMLSALALAAAMAEGNWGPVLLIDATSPRTNDWRSAAQAGPHRGLTDCALGAATLEQVALASTIPGLSLLTRGSQPLLPHWQTPASLTGQIRRRYRFSFVDYGRIEESAASDWSLGSDGLLLVCPENIPRAILRGYAKSISNISCPILGTIVVQK